MLGERMGAGLYRIDINRCLNGLLEVGHRVSLGAVDQRIGLVLSRKRRRAYVSALPAPPSRELYAGVSLQTARRTVGRAYPLLTSCFVACRDVGATDRVDIKGFTSISGTPRGAVGIRPALIVQRTDVGGPLLALEDAERDRCLSKFQLNRPPCPPRFECNQLFCACSCATGFATHPAPDGTVGEGQ
jgi:hypothetical protein